MNLRQVLRQARGGRPDLAAANLATSRGNGMLNHPARFLRVVVKYPHQCGEFFTLAELASIYRSYMNER